MSIPINTFFKLLMAQQAFSPDTCDQTIKIQLFAMEGGEKTERFDG